MPAEPEAEIQENPEKRRFELTVDGQVAYLLFTRDNWRMWLLDTFTPPSVRGQGIGERLAKHGLDHARANGLAVVPICPYVAAYIRDHSEYQDLVAAS
jgi:predicted GNAT family acetyltransferase